MDIGLYLRRIKYNGIGYGDMQTLRTLLRGHVFNIPFEDMDIHNGTPIVLQLELLYRKVVLDKRGGYCYELNLLFHHLLSSFGFKVSLISGRLLHGHGYGPEFEHMALLVELDGQKWLVDTGYGDFSVEPLSILPGEWQSDGRAQYLITDNLVVEGQKYLGVSKWNPSKHAFKTEYIFTLTPRVLREFAGMHHFHQTSPDSNFVRSFICSLPTADGRISVINNKLIRTGNGAKQVRTIPDEAEKQELLKKYFNIDLSYVPPAVEPVGRYLATTVRR